MVCAPVHHIENGTESYQLWKHLEKVVIAAKQMASPIKTLCFITVICFRYNSPYKKKDRHTYIPLIAFSVVYTFAM